MEDTVALMLLLALIFGAATCVGLWELRKLRKELTRLGPGAPCEDRISARLRCLDERLRELDRSL